MLVSKKLSSLVSFLLGIVLFVSCAFPLAYAAEPTMKRTGAIADDRQYLIVNGTEIVRVGEDYENPETGEYIHWTNDSRSSVDKKFEFKIRWSLTTASFTVHSNKVEIACDADVQSSTGIVLSGYNGHKYTVSLIGVYSRNLQFAVGGTEFGTVDGLKTGGNYKVQISNNDYLASNVYLVGTGTVEPV